MSEQSEVERLRAKAIEDWQGIPIGGLDDALDALIAAVRAQQSAEVARLRELLRKVRDTWIKTLKYPDHIVWIEVDAALAKPEPGE